MQSASHLIIQGHEEYKKDNLLTGFLNWKVGAYEVCGDLPSGIEYHYTIDLDIQILSCDCEKVSPYSFKKAV